MCYPEGSIQHATSVCPMCKIFKPSGRCPHKQDVCHNAANHPRFSVVHFTNAEVQTFNGCGYCKWTKNNPDHKLSGYQNPGWPGCCRPPKESDFNIPPADWPAVSAVHNVPIPLAIKTALMGAAKTSMPILPKGYPLLPSPSALDRRSSPSAVPVRTANSPRTQPLSIPGKSRSTGSPREANTPLSSTATPKGSVLKESPPDGGVNRKSLEQAGQRDRGDSPNTPSPLRRHIELEGTIKKTPDRRSSVSKIITKPGPEAILPSLRRRASTADEHNSTSPPSERRPVERHNTIGPLRSQAKRASLDINFSVLSLSQQQPAASVSPLSPTSDSSDTRSLSSGSSSEGTVTSDGGFTDYLSDESEAEIQRQAEARAALLAQNQMEDMEFKAARKQLAHVGLRPPNAWNLGGSGSASSTTRPQAQTQPAAPYAQAMPSYNSGHTFDMIGDFSHSR